MSLADSSNDLEILSAEFIKWAKAFLNCTELQAQQLLQRTRDIFDQGSRAIPSMLVQHSVPFSFCLAYLRQSRQAGESLFTPRYDTLDLDLCEIARALGVFLPNLKTDNASVALLPPFSEFVRDLASIGHQKYLEYLADCTAQLNRCFELIQSYPDRIAEILPISEDVASVISAVLTALRHSSRTSVP